MGRLLKYSRMVVAAAILVMAVALLLVPSGDMVRVTQWVADIQLFTLALGFALGWFMLWIALTLMLGRIYCSTVCPLGTLMDLFARLRGRRRIYRYSAPSTRLRYLMLSVAIAASVLGISYIYRWLDPYSDFAVIVTNLAHPAKGSALGLVIAAGLLIAVGAVAWWRGRLICNTVCPVGTALGVVSRYSIMHIDIDTDLCTNCLKCADVCKAECIDLHDHVVDSSRCVDCFNCLTVCPNSAIRYTSQRKQLSIPMMQPLGPTAASVPPRASYSKLTVPRRCAAGPPKKNQKLNNSKTQKLPHAPIP